MSLYQPGTLKINGGTIDTYTTPFNVDVVKHGFNALNYDVRFYYAATNSVGSPYPPYLTYLYYFDFPIQRLLLDDNGGIYSSPPSISWNGSVVSIGSGTGHLARVSWFAAIPAKNLSYSRPTTMLNGVVDPVYQVVAWR